jgi:hypothetical protein
MKMICCGTCEHHTMKNGEWYCNNQDSENYVLETEYEDYCEDYERRNV